MGPAATPGAGAVINRCAVQSRGSVSGQVLHRWTDWHCALSLYSFMFFFFVCFSCCGDESCDSGDGHMLLKDIPPFFLEDKETFRVFKFYIFSL